MTALGKYLQIQLDIPVGGGYVNMSHGAIVSKGAQVSIDVTLGDDVHLSDDANVTSDGPGYLFVHERDVVSKG